MRPSHTQKNKSGRLFGLFVFFTLVAGGGYFYLNHAFAKGVKDGVEAAQNRAEAVLDSITPSSGAPQIVADGDYPLPPSMPVESLPVESLPVENMPIENMVVAQQDEQSPMLAPMDEQPLQEAAAPLADPNAVTPVEMPVEEPQMPVQPSLVQDQVQQPAPPAADEQVMHVIENRLSALEENIQRVDQNQVTKSDFETLSAQVSDLQNSIAGLQQQIERKKQETVSENTDAPKKAVVKKARTKAKAAVRAAPAEPPPVLTLKSAVPGTAWLLNETTGAMVSVSTGAYLKGYGQVSSIRKDANGHWMVETEKGVIRQ